VEDEKRRGEGKMWDAHTKHKTKQKTNKMTLWRVRGGQGERETKEGKKKETPN
jgi:hypothetical protein